MRENPGRKDSQRFLRNLSSNDKYNFDYVEINQKRGDKKVIAEEINIDIHLCIQ